MDSGVALCSGEAPFTLRNREQAVPKEEGGEPKGGRQNAAPLWYKKLIFGKRVFLP